MTTFLCREPSDTRQSLCRIPDKKYLAFKPLLMYSLPRLFYRVSHSAKTSSSVFWTFCRLYPVVWLTAFWAIQILCRHGESYLNILYTYFAFKTLSTYWKHNTVKSWQYLLPRWVVRFRTWDDAANKPLYIYALILVKYYTARLYIYMPFRSWLKAGLFNHPSLFFNSRWNGRKRYIYLPLRFGEVRWAHV